MPEILQKNEGVEVEYKEEPQFPAYSGRSYEDGENEEEDSVQNVVFAGRIRKNNEEEEAEMPAPFEWSPAQ